MKNALMEAAAEILAGSKSTAPRMEMEKSAQGFEDLGGVTPHKSVADKLDPHAKEATPPGKQPDSDTKAPLVKTDGPTEIDPAEQGGAKSEEESERQARIEAGLRSGYLKEEEDDEDEDDEEEEEEDEEDKKKVDEDWKQQLKEDVNAILQSETTLPKEFAAKVGTIYEARVNDKVSQLEEQIEKEYSTMFEAAVLEVREALTEKVNDYLDYVVEEWMKQNELAIEKGLRSELTEEFISGLRELFAEHYIDVPSEKVDVVDELATKVEDLQSALNEEVAKGVELKKQLSESKKHTIINSVCEGLTQTQVEKVRTLAESVEFTAEGDFRTKATTIRENYFPTSKRKTADGALLTEATEVLHEERAASPEVDAVIQAIARSLK